MRCNSNITDSICFQLMQEHALIEQAVADVLTLRSVGREALANRLKQLQAVRGAVPVYDGQKRVIAGSLV